MCLVINFCIMIPVFTFRYPYICDHINDYECRSDRRQQNILFPFMLILHLVNLIVSIIACGFACVHACACCSRTCCGCCCHESRGKIYCRVKFHWIKSSVYKIFQCQFLTKEITFFEQTYDNVKIIGVKV